MRSILLFLLSIGLQQFTFAQNKSNETYTYKDLSDIESKIATFGKMLHTDTSRTNRQQAAQQIALLLEKELADKNTYDYPFENLTGVSLLQPEDKSFRIFSWELYESPLSYIQYGIIQTQKGDVFVLQDKSIDMNRPEFGRNKADNWYGALYYNIKAFKTNKKTHYLLFGRDSYNIYEHRKVLDVLYFDQKGEPRFGSNVIKVKDGYGRLRMVNRFLLQYSAGVYVKLNYDEQLGMVVYDHLISGAGIVKGQQPTGVPDGSYCGLQLKKGRWEYLDKVFKDDPKNVLVQDQSPQKIMSRKRKKRENDLRKMFGGTKK